MSENKKPKIGVLIYTYNRVDDAKINLEIVDRLWKKSGLFAELKVVHSYNGEEGWYPKKYLEDYLVRIKNSGHFQGASELFDAGFAECVRVGLDSDYLVFLAADTWIVKPEFVDSIIRKMRAGKKALAASSWDALPDKPGDMLKAMSVDFFVLDYKWARGNKIFPLNYKEFKEKYEDLFYYQGGVIMLEKLLISHVLRAFREQSGSDVEFRAIAMSNMLQIKEREPVHTHVTKEGLWVRKMYWPEIGLITHHDPKEKQKVLREIGFSFGKNIQKFIAARDISYYNGGFVSTQKIN